jgi:hypothetical protein
MAPLLAFCLTGLMFFIINTASGAGVAFESVLNTLHPSFFQLEPEHLRILC